MYSHCKFADAGMRRTAMENVFRACPEANSVAVWSLCRGAWRTAITNPGVHAKNGNKKMLPALEAVWSLFRRALLWSRFRGALRTANFADARLCTRPATLACKKRQWRKLLGLSQDGLRSRLEHVPRSIAYGHDKSRCVGVSVCIELCRMSDASTYLRSAESDVSVVNP